MISCHYAGLVGTTGWVAPLGLIAGSCLTIGSIFHFINGHTLPATNFGVYGSLWMSVGLYMLLAPDADFDDAMTFIRCDLMCDLLIFKCVTDFECVTSKALD